MSVVDGLFQNLDLPDAEVLISARDARLLRKDLSLDPGEPQAKIGGSLPGAETRPSRTLAPGERVGSLEVIDTAIDEGNLAL